MRRGARRSRALLTVAVLAALSLGAACAGCGNGGAGSTGGDHAVDAGGRWHRTRPEQVGLDAKACRTSTGEFVTSSTARSRAVDPRVRAITLRQLLEMRAGLTATSDYLRPRDALRLSLTCDPGTCFIYNEIDSHLLSSVLARTTGMSAAELARTHLFAPLGIGASRWSWPADAAGASFGGSGLALLARDMARIGYLLLRGGRWGGHQIVPAGYVPRRDLVVVTKGAFENGNMESLIDDVVGAVRD